MDFMAGLTPGPCLFLYPLWGIPEMLSTACSSFPWSWRCEQQCPGLLCAPSSVPMAVPLQVAGLFHHASIGNPINIAIVRLILLEHEEVRAQQGLSPGSQAGMGWELVWKTRLPPGLSSWPGRACVREIQVTTFASLSWLVEPGAVWAEELQSMLFGVVYDNTASVRWQRALGHCMVVSQPLWWLWGARGHSGAPQLCPSPSASTGGFPAVVLNPCYWMI